MADDYQDSIATCVDSLYNCSNSCCHCEVEATATTDVATPATHNTGAYVVGGVGVALALCVGFLLWKLRVRFKKEMADLRKQLTSSNATASSKKKDMSQSTIATPQSKANVITVQNIEQSPNTRKENNSTTNSKTKSKAPANLVRYATLQAPDENGVLRFAERSMVEEPSSQKMFILELDPDKGIGTYRINPNAKALIFGDLQLFAEFVKPFSFSGSLTNATIKNQNVGRITRQGSYWVVDELLEIIME